MYIESYTANKRRYYRLRARTVEGYFIKQLGNVEKIYDDTINFAKLKEYVVEAKEKGQISHEVLREINNIITTKNVKGLKIQDYEEVNNA